MLSDFEQQAHALVMAEATFPKRINANKAKWDCSMHWLTLGHERFCLLDPGGVLWRIGQNTD